MQPSRGPTGAAAPPPPDLATRELPLSVLPAGSLLARIHRSEHGPVFFGPGPGRPPTHRFDSATGRFGVLYLGLTWEAAFAETLLRTPARRLVAEADIAARALTMLSPTRGLTAVAALGPGLSTLGTDAALSTGPYAPCGLWADALFDHPARPDGILYASRHDPSLTCLALFDRDDPGLTVQATTPLPDMATEIGALLDRYGKALG